MCEFRNSKQAKEGYQSRLMFKKRMFRETDETVTETQFINLSYVQVGCSCFCGSTLLLLACQQFLPLSLDMSCAHLVLSCIRKATCL